MALVVLACRLVLAGVLGAAGITKLRDLAEASEAAANLGVPRRAARPTAVTTCICELVAAAALLSPFPAIGAGLAVALLLAFTIVVARTVLHGEHPDCHCFGNLHSSPVGWGTVARNIALAGSGFVVLAGAGRWPFSDAADRISSLGAGGLTAIAAGAVLVAAVAIEGRLIFGILKQNGRLLLRLDELEAQLAHDGAGAVAQALEHAGPPIGSKAPAFSLPDALGGTVTTADLLEKDLPVLLVFGDPSCGPCEDLLPEVAAWQRDEAERLTVVLVSRGDRRENMDKIARHGLGTVLLQKDDEVAVSFGYLGTPGAVKLAADGTVASHVVAGANAIRSLVRAATCETAAPARPPVPAIGTAAPEVHLTSLSGDPVDLRSFRGADAVVLFWNPSCGFCKAMLAKLRAWDEERAGDTSLLVVSSGSSEANVDLAEMGSAVVLDGSGATMRAFGATGTPMAIRIDADGLVASAMQIGSEAVLGMLGAVVAETVT